VSLEHSFPNCGGHGAAQFGSEPSAHASRNDDLARRSRPQGAIHAAIQDEVERACRCIQGLYLALGPRTRQGQRGRSLAGWKALVAGAVEVRGKGKGMGHAPQSSDRPKP
jgi:hypothetical protein